MNTRGDFLETVALAALVPAAPRFPTGLRKPPRLARGDRVGLVAPASPPTGDDIRQAVAHVESLGLVPVLGDHVEGQNGYLAGTDAERAADFNRMAADRQIRAIVAIRGGYGTMRILTRLDYAALARDPKIVLGYSDVTAILNAVAVRSRIVTFHGPVGAHGSSWSGEARLLIERLLFAGEAPGRLKVGPPIVPGRARGRLAGGNLSLIAALVGTPYAVPAQDSLLFFEETQEQPYRIDRMLTQLDLAGVLRAASGILVGRCVKCAADGPSQSADAVIAERLRSAGRPAAPGAL
ncbi:MAG: LD-carboxypeptidase, partial [Candidatus Baltobacteraceae bacterium]